LKNNCAAQQKEYPMTRNLVVALDVIERRIYLIRGQKVMLDRDLAELYGVATGNLNLAVRRNALRFPEDFMFQLSAEETKSLLLQSARAKVRGGRRIPPHAFTEQGVAMLSSVLKTRRAVLVNIVIMRAFVKQRAMLATHGDILRKLEELESKYHTHDAQIASVFNAIRGLIATSRRPRPRIGFTTIPTKRRG
jgi:hypothetical protein